MYIRVISEETGLYYLQARYYDPETARFISPDKTDYLEPQSFGGLNLYIYCLDNPVMYADPSGNFAISTFLITLAISSLVSWGLSEIFGLQIAGGIGSFAGGATAISTGINLCAFGPLGIAAGITMMMIAQVRLLSVRTKYMLASLGIIIFNNGLV